MAASPCHAQSGCTCLPAQPPDLACPTGIDTCLRVCPMQRMLLVIALTTVATGRVAAADPDDGIAFFESRIRPVLAEQCYGCHGEKKQRGKLRLDSKEALLKGGESGPAIVAG